MPRKTTRELNFRILDEDNIVSLTVGNPDLVDIKDGLDEVESQLKKTHLGHETNLWGQEINEEESL